jgi:hypothetical protein
MHLPFFLFDRRARHAEAILLSTGFVQNGEIGERQASYAKDMLLHPLFF